MKAILFLAASILALTSAVLADECTWGVSYWCQNKANAEKCDKVSYCNDHVWNQKGKEGIDDLKDAILLRGSPVRQFYKKYDQKPTEPQSIQCEICKVVVKEAVKYLDDNKTETEVKDAVENVCTLFGSFESQCKDLIDSYFDQIWQALVNNVTPDEVCSTIQLCASGVKSDVPLKRGRGKGVSSNCRLCDNFRNIIVHASRDHVTRSKAKEKLRTTCKGLKMKETKCDKFIDEHFMHLWRGVMKEATSSSTCKNMFPDCSVPVPHHRARRSLECYACKEGVSILMKYIKKSSMKTKITDAANKLCTSFLPPKDLQHCEALLDPVVGIAWEDILTIMINHTDEVCSFIGACSSTSSRMILAQNLLPSRPSTKSIIKHKNVKQDLCGTCKMVISFIKPYVDSNSTEQEVKDALNAICNLLPGSTKDECTSFVKTYFPTIWTLIKTEVDSGDVCKQIGLCPNATMAISKREVKKNSLILKSKIVKQDLCTTCKLVVTFAKPFVDSNSTEQEVKAAVEQFCGILPASYKSQCTALIDTYFFTLWSLLESEFDHDLICYQLRLCTNSTGLISLVKERLSKVDFKSVNVDSCSLCKEVVDILQPYANSSTTEAVVKNALIYVCGYLSDVLNMTSLSQQCTDAVKVYFGIVWEIMKDELANDLICSQLNLCNSIELSYHKKFSSAQCVECELLTKYVYDYLKSSSSEVRILYSKQSTCIL
jgi:saposin